MLNCKFCQTLAYQLMAVVSLIVLCQPHVPGVQAEDSPRPQNDSSTNSVEVDQILKLEEAILESRRKIHSAIVEYKTSGEMKEYIGSDQLSKKVPLAIQTMYFDKQSVRTDRFWPDGKEAIILGFTPFNVSKKGVKS